MLLLLIYYRSQFIQVAKYTRYEFDQRVNLSKVDDINDAILLGELYLQDNTHPDPYTIPRQEGGSMFQRNAAQDPWLIGFDPEDVDPYVYTEEYEAEIRKKNGLAEDPHHH